MNTFAVPMWSVKVRHPEFGWCTVAVGGEKSCLTAYNRWKRNWGEFSMSLLHISGFLTYTVVAQHSGSYRYAR